MSTTATTLPARDAVRAGDIPEQDRATYSRLATQELTAFVKLIEQLGDDDWPRPSPCSLWDVRDIVAHQGGHVRMGSGFWNFMAQLNPITLAPYRKRGMIMLDALNQRHVDMRRGKTVEELIAEVRDGTPKALVSRRRLNAVARRVPIPAPQFGFVSLGTLLDRTFPRDMWIHRLDIADATGKHFEQTPGHDDVMVALTVADAARSVAKKAPGVSFILSLDGPAGGRWLFGKGGAATPELRMGVTDFMRRTSGRKSVQETLEVVESTAPESLTLQWLEVLEALY